MDTSRRLLELERILVSSQSAATAAWSSSADTTESMLNVLLDRIRQTTSLLSESRGTDIDAADSVAVRLLLADYASAVAHLRAATRSTEARLGRAAAVIKEDGRRVKAALDETIRRQGAKATAS